MLPLVLFVIIEPGLSNGCLNFNIVKIKNPDLCLILNSKNLNLVVFSPSSSEAPHSPVKSSPETSPTNSLRQRRDSDRYCQLCNAWFNNPGMAQQHYDGKKHKKNAARADLLEQLGKTLDMGEMKGMKARLLMNYGPF